MLFWTGLGVVALLPIVGVAWMVSLPPVQTSAAPGPVPTDETNAVLSALKPPKRERPLVAILGLNRATEVTDYLMPYGILRRADVADVVSVATGPGPIRLYPTLTIQPDATVADFDTQHPEGADYVVVPAMEPDSDAAALDWIRAQAAKGATVIGVCAGARVVGAAGLLDGKRATTHWYYVDGMLKQHPTIQYVADRRLVVDGQVATTTGISAAMPAMLTLIEAIGGREKATAVAHDLGVADWDTRHASAAFRFTRPFATTVLRNAVAVWNREELGIELRQGVDEVSLALIADAWSRTYRSHAVTFAGAAGAVETRHGLRIVPDTVASDWPAARLIPAFDDRLPAPALDDTLERIAGRYGPDTRDVVAMQLEYPKPATPPAPA
jgi:putative intracellular protease/amidase